ncbi:NIPSNAP family protein [Thalassospira lucentensis]|uniref:NIPSNAP family protein n=1 Tax=Thalassospira lucentensis TaxID=168935 RepID=UPI00294348B6|nr:NIPSNAP family protein [Thalassospira lucentensis]WOI10022.1 NIPSNAP family protein [Thalassospira lucentensis]
MHTSIIELRRYRLKPGTRQALIDLFDREFIESQEACGMSVIGQFRDLDDANSFAWLRGFADMDDRAKALGAFYTGPVWAQHCDAANGTMVNSDNVLLLRPAHATTGFATPAHPRPAITDGIPATGFVEASICALAPGRASEFAAFFAEKLRPVLRDCGADILAELISETAPNSFPRLPVREGETVFVWLTRFDSPSGYATFSDRLASHPDWQNHLASELDQWLWRPREILRLAPTARSHLR